MQISIERKESVRRLRIRTHSNARKFQLTETILALATVVSGTGQTLSTPNLTGARLGLLPLLGRGLHGIGRLLGRARRRLLGLDPGPLLDDPLPLGLDGKPLLLGDAALLLQPLLLGLGDGPRLGQPLVLGGVGVLPRLVEEPGALVQILEEGREQLAAQLLGGDVAMLLAGPALEGHGANDAVPVGQVRQGVGIGVRRRRGVGIRKVEGPVVLIVATIVATTATVGRPAPRQGRDISQHEIVGRLRPAGGGFGLALGGHFGRALLGGRRRRLPRGPLLHLDLPAGLVGADGGGRGGCVRVGGAGGVGGATAASRAIDTSPSPRSWVGGMGQHGRLLSDGAEGTLDLVKVM